MSGMKDGKFVIEPEPHRPCEFCLTIQECRPYGPGGRDICFECSQLPEYAEICEHNFGVVIGDEEEMK